MNALERLASTGGNGIGKYSFKDADTVADADGNAYRLEGFDAPEIAGFKGGQWTGGTEGGTGAGSEIQKLMRDQGYTNLVKSLDENGNPKVDSYGRTLARFQNDKGEDFATKLIASGALRSNTFMDQDELDAIEVEKVFGSADSDAFASAAEKITTLIDGEQAENVIFKQAAATESTYDPRYNTSALDFRQMDRDIRNNAYNPLGDAWDTGWIGAKEGMYGALEMLGDTTGSEWLTDIGEAGIVRAQNQAQEKGHILTDYKDVDSFGTAMQFLGNNVAMSLPYMAITAGGVAAGVLAAPFITGAGAIALGVSAPAAVYSGQVWNEMEGEKNAAVAVGAGLVQASLDRLGLGGLAGKLIPDKAFSQGVKHIMAKKGVGKEVAEQMLSNATRLESRTLLQEAAKVATKQQAGKRTFLDLLKRTSLNGGTEAVTEAMQEATAYTAAIFGGSEGTFNWEDLNQRMISAAIAGGAIGGAMSTPGAIRQGIKEYDLFIGGDAATDVTASVSQQYANQEKSERGYVPSIEENILEANTRSEGFIQHQGRSERHRAGQKRKSFTQRAAELALNPQALWQGATRNIFNPDLQSRSRSARVMADMFGGNLQRIFSGANFESDKFHRVATYKNMIGNPDGIFSAMGRGKRATKELKKTISNKLYASMTAAVDKDGNFDPNLVPDSDPDKATIVDTAKKLNAMADKMWRDQAKYNPKLGFVKNYLMKYKALDKKAVQANRKGFEDLLQKKHKYSKNDAVKLVDEILNNSEVRDLDEAFSIIKGGAKPTAHKQRSLGLSEDVDFKEFMDQDLFSNISQAAKSAAKYGAHQKYIGDNGSVISKLLDQMEAEGVPEAEVDKVASQMQDYLDAESGNYKRPVSTAGKRAAKFQKNLMMLMTLSGLPLATISSFVELMLVNRGLTSEQVWGKKGSMKHIGTEFAATIKGAMGEVASAASRRDLTRFDPQSAAREKLQELGFYDWDVGAATVTGVTEVNEMQQHVYEAFFKATGLTGWTNYTRAARAAVGLDYMNENADIIWAHRMGKSEYTRDVQQAEEKLRNLGVDIDTYAELQTKITGGIELNPTEQAFMADSIREGTFNFVNEAIALPQSANRPLIYQDPRFALFTQFQGFIATFTANHIPKLWGEYVKRGTPSMKYNAFATAATMIMMGFLSMALKDEIKYGFGDNDEDFAETTQGNPYLETPEYIRRGIQASGLLGTAERPLNFFAPLYGNQSNDAGDWLFNSTVGESPALGWGERAIRSGKHLLAGEGQKGIEQALKAAPVIGPFSLFNRRLSEGDWNFDGR